jgi:hypothetical protein
MKKNTKRARLQSIDAAQLAKVTGGSAMCDLAGAYDEGTGWHEFFDAAGGGCTISYTCTPRWN